MSFSILTTSANEFMSKIHNRMPVILDRSNEEAWIDPKTQDENLLQEILKPCPDSWLTAVEVSPLVNSAKNDGPKFWSQRPASVSSGRVCSLSYSDQSSAQVRRVLETSREVRSQCGRGGTEDPTHDAREHDQHQDVLGSMFDQMSILFGVHGCLDGRPE